MKNKRLSFVLSVLLMSVSMVVICACILIPTIKIGNTTTGTGNTYVNKNYETNGGNIDVSNPSNDKPEIVVPESESLKFFINEQTVLKTKKIVGDTTMFTISFKVFAMNEGLTSKTVKGSAFTGKYDIGNCASFYQITCNDLQSSKTIQTGESEDFDISITYVITNTENFKDNQKYDLTVSYMAKNIISLQVWWVWNILFQIW